MHSNQNIENIVIGLMIDNERVRNYYLANLSENDFENESNLIVFKIIRDIVNENRKVDLMIIDLEIQKKGMNGIRSKLHDYVDSYPSVSNYKDYLKELKRYTEKRNIKQAGLKLVDLSQEKEDNLSEKAESILYDSLRKHDILEYKGLNVLAYETLHYIEKVSNGYKGITVGLKGFDRINRWFESGNFYVLGGRPGMGKTAFALKLAVNIAKQNIPVMFFSLEMTERELTTRALAMETGIILDKLEYARLTEEESKLLVEAAGLFKTYPLYVDDTPKMKKDNMFSKIRLMARRGVQIVFIDHLILIDNKSAGKSRHEQIGDVTGDLKALAKELKIPIVALSQVRREVEERSDKRPYASDMKECGDIEQDADAVIAIYRDDYYNTDKPDCRKNITELIFRKKRNGRCGTAYLYTDLSKMLYEDIENHEEAIHE